MLKFEVHDTGVGIPLAKQNLLFKRFSQIDSSASKKEQGTGLGLSLCKKMVELMDGAIHLESLPDEGSIFIFEIPFVEAKSLDVIKDNTVAPFDCVTSNLMVLLVDDSEENRDLIKLYFKNRSCEIDTAVNGKEAFDKFMRKKYDIVLMDIQMPEMDGFEATRKIREWENNQNKTETPIIALTGYALKEEQEKCIAAGCTLHVAKPIKKADLLKIVFEHTQKQSK